MQFRQHRPITCHARGSLVSQTTSQIRAAERSSMNRQPVQTNGPATSTSALRDVRVSQALGPDQSVDDWASNGRPADLTILNGRVATMVRSRPFVRHLAIRDGLVLAASDDE